MLLKRCSFVADI